MLQDGVSHRCACVKLRWSRMSRRRTLGLPDQFWELSFLPSFLHFLRQIAVQKMSGKPPGSARQDILLLDSTPNMTGRRLRRTMDERARYDAELPPIISIGRYPARPIISFPDRHPRPSEKLSNKRVSCTMLGQPKTSLKGYRAIWGYRSDTFLRHRTIWGH